MTFSLQVGIHLKYIGSGLMYLKVRTSVLLISAGTSQLKCQLYKTKLTFFITVMGP